MQALDFIRIIRAISRINGNPCHRTHSAWRELHPMKPTLVEQESDNLSPSR
jgi:hypothetical protein